MRFLCVCASVHPHGVCAYGIRVRVCDVRWSMSQVDDVSMLYMLACSFYDVIWTLQKGI